jgi:arylsulfatase A-like enzyme
MGGSRQTAGIAAAWLLACAGGDAPPPDVCSARTADAGPPSIVLVVADTLRADFLGYAGLGPGVSPALDAFAAEAVDFQNAFSQAPWTKPSVASLFTGLHPQAHGVTDHEGHFWSGGEGAPSTGVLPARLETLAEGLGAAGYATAGFVANRWLTRGYGFDQGFELYEEIDPARPGAVFARAVGWLAQRDPARPFLLYLHAMEVHGPYEAPEPFVEAVRGSPGLAASRTLSEAELAAVPEYLRASPWARTPAARELREWRTRYAAGVAALDRGFGLFARRLREAGLLESSVVVFTSDHGEELHDHGGWDHGRTLYDEELHVPLLVRLPAGRHGGRRVDSIASLVDLHPTLLELAGAAPPGSHGESLLPLACGAPDAGERMALASATKGRPDLFALRTREHKLVLDVGSGAGVLYDLVADPGERRDAAPETLARADALAQRLFAHAQRMQREAGASPELAPVDPELVSHLRSLGYTE